MAVLDSRTTRPSGRPPTRLQGRRLPGYALPALAAAAVLLTLGLFAVTPMQGVADFVVVAALVYVVAQTVVSFRFEGRRQAKDRLFTTFVVVAFLLAAAPLVIITWYTVKQGIGVITSKLLTTSMFRVDPDGPGGGIYHAIIGTCEQSRLATAIAAPLGILAAVYLVEYGGRRPFARTVSFFVDVMTGVPSIVAGLFIYSAWILVLGFQKSGFAGSLALFILMLPVVIRATEEMLKLVPNDLREAAYALGVPKWRTILRVVLPTLLGGINQRIETNPFAGQSTPHAQESLPTFIFEQFQVAVGNTDAPAFRRAWGAALALIVIIGLLNLLARLVARFARVRS